MLRDVLRRQGWLSHQPQALQDAVLANGREQRFPAGSTVFSVGDPPGGCYAILQGHLAVSIAPNQNGPTLAHVARQGTWYGEGAFLTRGPRRITLQAVVDCVLFHLPLDAMDRLAAEDPEWIRRFALILMSNIDLAIHAIDDLLIRDPSRRIAAVLVRCLGEGCGGTLSISQTELGRLTNTSRKVVNQTLDRFAQLGWIEKGYGRIEVIDPLGLRDHAQDS